MYFTLTKTKNIFQTNLNFVLISYVYVRIIWQTLEKRDGGQFVHYPVGSGAPREISCRLQP